MILRLKISSIPPALIFFLLSFSVITTKAVDDTPFSCNLVVNDVHFDLSRLAGEHVLNRTRETPPTKTVDSLRFDLCADLAPQEALSEKDQCPTGTRACLTQVNMKESDADRIINIIPIVQSSKLDAKYTVSSSDQKFVNILFDGPDYPHPSNSTPVTQHLNLTIICGTEDSTGLKLLKYDGSFLDFEWTTPAGCATKGDDSTPSPPDGGSPSEPEKAVGSGIGWFFLVVLLAFAAYFGLGAYYNYSTYGSRGLDLIPHRDFWQEVPYMLKDVVSHLCSTVRPRRTQARNGYISV